MINFLFFLGMIDVTKDPDYEHVYDKLPVEQPGDTEMAEERRYFMSKVEDLSMQMTLFQKNIKQYKNLFVLEPDWIVSSIVRLLEDQIDQTGEMAIFLNWYYLYRFVKNSVQRYLVHLLFTVEVYLKHGFHQITRFEHFSV